MSQPIRLVSGVLLLLGLAGPLAGLSAPDLALRELRARHGDSWSLARHATTGRVRRLVGGAVFMADPSVLSTAPRQEADTLLAGRLLGFLDANADLLDLEAEVLASLRLSPAGVIHASGGRLRILHLEHAPGGVPVLGARATAVVSRGNLIGLHLVGLEPVTAELEPTVHVGEAMSLALGAVESRFEDLVSGQEPALHLRPHEGGHQLVWRAPLLTRPDHRLRVVLVDAHTGEVLSVTDETVEACDPPPASGAIKRVLGGVRPERADEQERVELLPHARVGDAELAGRDGFFTPPGTVYDGFLEGALARVDCADCTAPVSPLAPAGPSGDVDFGTGGTDGTGNGLATPADRAVYFHTTRAQERAARWLPLPWLTEPLPVRTNIASSCNAFWNGVSLNFFRSSSTCGNTGEIRDVVLHEWGHGLDSNDGLSPSSLSVDAATGEAVGDIAALLASRDSCIGESFFKNASRNASRDCSGVRDVDELAPDHERGSPATLSTDNVPSKCGPSLTYRGPLGGEGHCEGEVMGQAFWHLVRNLLHGASYADGSPLPDGALPEEEAWRVAEELFYASRPMLASYAPSHLQSIGMSAWDAFLLADDEGDGIGNGTPHAAAITEALIHHGMQEVGPVPPDSDGCTPPPAPLAAAETIVPSETGLPAVRITWNDVGAVSYQVLRADDPGDAYQPVGPPLAAGVTARVDRGVLPARAYYYLVEATNAAGCSSLSAAPVIGSGGPLLRIDAVTVDDAGSANPDGVLEAGESADLYFDLVNVGSAGASGVSVTLASAEPELVVTDPGPLDYGDIPAGAVAAAPGPFTVQAGADVPRFVSLEIEAEADEGCLRARHRLELGVVDLALVSSADTEAAGTGDGDGDWEPGEEADLAVDLRNEGLLDAVDVTGVLAFRGAPVPGVTILQDSGSWGTLAGVGPAATGTPLFQLAADPTLGSRTKVPLRLDVSVGGVFHRSFELSASVGGFPAGELEWSWDSGVSGTPLVLQLTDDDGDGEITRCDVPDVVIASSTGMEAVSGDGSGSHWFVEPPCGSTSAFSNISGGDIDGDGRNEIVNLGEDRYLCAVGSDGSIEWRSGEPLEEFDGRVHPVPQAWDLEGDGSVEVVVSKYAFRGEDGTIEWDDRPGFWARVVVGDLDLDGFLEVVSGTDAYRWDGSPYSGSFSGWNRNGFPVKLTDDPHPQIVTVGGGDIRALHHTGALYWLRDDLPTNGTSALACAADFDRDGRAEIGVATRGNLLLLDDDGETLWSIPTEDASGAAGCSAFDFEGDGVPEIVYRDEQNLRVVDGVDGEVLWQTPIWSGTAFEVPIIADFDGDGSAEIGISGRISGVTGGFHVFGSPRWTSARGVWNQEDYNVNQVTETGGIVSNPLPRWLGANDWRTQAVVCPCDGPSLEMRVDLPSCAPESPDPQEAFDFTACFEAEITGGFGPMDVTWTFGDGSPPSSSLTPCHTFPGPGSWPVRVEIRDLNGCRQEAGTLLRLAERPVVDFVPTPACLGEERCFMADLSGGTAPFDFAWDMGDGTRLTGPAVCHTWAGGGTFEVALAVEDTNGCDAEVRHPVEILDPDALPEVSGPGAAVPLRVAKDPGSPSDLVVTWEDTGIETGLYRGDLDALATTGYDHEAVACRLFGGETSLSSAPGVNRYFLATSAACSDPRREGPYGSTSAGTPRPSAADLARPVCP